MSDIRQPCRWRARVRTRFTVRNVVDNGRDRGNITNYQAAVQADPSTEYFSNVMSLNRGNMVSRTTRIVGSDTVETLRFLGAPNQRSAMTSPRAQIGTGLTVTARETLTVRLSKTRDPSVPVRIQITANGDASRGHKEEIHRRGAILTMGGNLVRQGSGWVWMPIGG